MNMNNEWDNIIKEKLGAIAEAPPAYMWDKIAGGLPAAAVKVAFYQTLTFKIAAIAATIIFLLTFGWLLNRNRDSINTIKNATSLNSDRQINNTKKADYTTHTTPQTKINKQTSFVKNANDKITNQSYSNKPTTETYPNTNNSTISKPIYKTSKITKNSTKDYKTNSTEIADINTNTSEQDKTNTGNNNIAISSNDMNTKAAAKTTNPKITAEIASSEIATHKQNNKLVANTPATKVNKQATDTQKSNTNTVTKNITATNKTTNTQNKEKDKQQQIAQYSDNTESDTTNESPIVSSQAKSATADFHPQTRNFNRIGFGLHYGIESIYVDNSQLFSNNIDLSFNYQNLNFIFQSGIGIQHSKDIRNYNLEYMRNDYLTTEMRFDSATFVMDSTGNISLVPVNPYYTDIYDSVHHEYNASYNERYYSIRIPLLVGYQKDIKNFGIFAKGGIIYSRVVYKQKTAIYEPDESSRMIKLEYSGLERKSNQLEYVLAAGITYRINNSLQINGELMTKFFQNSLYDNPAYTNSSPWSMEARMGLVYYIN